MKRTRRGFFAAAAALAGALLFGKRAARTTTKVFRNPDGTIWIDEPLVRGGSRAGKTITPLLKVRWGSYCDSHDFPVVTSLRNGSGRLVKTTCRLRFYAR